MGATVASGKGDQIMKPAEIVTALVSIPVVAAFVVSVMTAPVEAPTPPKMATDVSAAFAQNVADEIVVVAKRAAASPAI